MKSAGRDAAGSDAPDSMGGRFPFGRPSGRCKPRRATKAKAFVLGVYPSALHVRWSGPGVRISYLAIDQEPWPFWDGHDEAQRIAKWRRDVEWQDAWGTATPPGKLNGSSGHKLRDHYLTPLGLNTDDVWLTDCLPFFHVWRGPGTQGAAMRERYDPFALQHQPLRTHELPDRPPAAQLIRRTLASEAGRLLGELDDSQAPVLITLGNEPLAVIRQLLDATLPPKLSHNAYGTRHQVPFQGRPLSIVPLVHPAQAGSGGRSATWAAAHQRWVGSDPAAKLLR